MTALFLLLWTALAWGAPVDVPEAQAAEWSGPASLHGWTLGQAGEGSYVKIRQQGPRLTLEVRGDDGVVRVRTVPWPTTAAQREDVMALARSLLREGRDPGLTARALTLPLPLPEPRTSRPPTAIPPPRNRSAPEPEPVEPEPEPVEPEPEPVEPEPEPVEPEPEPVQEPAVATQPPEPEPQIVQVIPLPETPVGPPPPLLLPEPEVISRPTGLRGYLGPVGGVELRTSNPVSVGTGPAFRAGLQGGVGVGVLELGGRVTTTTQARVYGGGKRSVSSTEGAIELGLRPWRVGPRAALVFAGSARSWEREDTRVAMHGQGSAGAQVGLVAPLGTRLELRGSGSALQDLAWTTLQEDGDVGVLQRTRLVVDIALVAVMPARSQNL